MILIFCYDFQKTISDLTNKIKTKENVILQITEKLNESLLQNDALSNQIKQLEEQIQSYLSNIQTADVSSRVINFSSISVCFYTIKIEIIFWASYPSFYTFATS